MEPTWVLSAPGGPDVGLMYIVIRGLKHPAYKLVCTIVQVVQNYTPKIGSWEIPEHNVTSNTFSEILLAGVKKPVLAHTCWWSN